MRIIDRILAVVQDPIVQSLALLLCTVFVLGCKAATGGEDSPWIIRITTVLLVLYMFKAISSLYRAIKEVSDVRRTAEPTNHAATRSQTE